MLGVPVEALMEAKSSLPKVLKWCFRKQESLGPLGSSAVGQAGIPVSGSGQLGLGGGLTLRLLALHLMMRVNFFYTPGPLWAFSYLFQQQPHFHFINEKTGPEKFSVRSQSSDTTEPGIKSRYVLLQVCSLTL